MITQCSSDTRKGFTLVEVLVAMVLFTMVIAGGLIGLSRGFELVDTSRNYTRSSQVLQSELELLRTLPWDTFTTVSADDLSTTFQAQIDSQFNVDDYVGTITTDLTDSLMKVTVTVAWAGRSGRVYTLSYITYFTEGGVNDYYIN